ncbi:3-deoxy-7-phosphoheptulonate synthase [Alloiococcus sp. CFN-8]|uniref:3-deoxy-7-phosphoheptulonate synthase n=1 Tax=Alloiococcus sp. CFN-8 TaxID=3416081 RepID=UPI003CFA806A
MKSSINFNIINDLFNDLNRPVIIAGPCAVESLDSMMSLSRRLKDIGVDMLRGGVYKPRTSPYDFQGLGEEGLKVLNEVRKELMLPVSTEIMDPRDIQKAIDYVDVIQIGSRNMYNYTLLREAGKTSVPIILKRGISATYKEWLSAAEYILKEGNNQIILCERGIRTFENSTRNTLDLNVVPYMKENTSFPIIVDPSHGTGIRSFVPPMSKAAIACGADGLLIEVHENPDEAISDSFQTIDVDILKGLIKDIGNK